MTAGLKIDVRADVKAAQRYLSKVQREAVKQAAARSLNRTVATVASQAVKTVAADLGVQQKVIRPKFYTWKAHKNALVAWVSGRGTGLPLELFKPKKTDAGVAYTAFGERKEIKSAFMRRDKPGVWKRVARSKVSAVPKSEKYPQLGFRRKTEYLGGLVARLPIRQLYGPSVPSSMRKEAIMGALRRVAEKRWAAEFPRQMKYYLDKLK